MSRKLTAVLSLAIIFQFLVLTGMYVSAAMPLWTGNEVRLRTVPVDPRSMFRGNYAQLRYEISQLDGSLVPDSDELRNGEVIYVVLKQGPDGLYEFSEVSLGKPADGVYLRGRIENRYYEAQIRVKYGIEAFFAPKEKALELERNLRESAVAVLMVSSEGKARLKDIIVE